jgi:hypothetical protein
MPSYIRRRTASRANVLVSLTSGLATFLLVILAFVGSIGLEARVLAGLGFAIFVAGVILVAQIMVEIHSRLDAVQAEQTSSFARTERQIHQEFKKINAATELFGAVEASALRTDAMTQLVSHATKLSETTPPLVWEFAQREISRLSEVLRHLGRGSDATYEGEERDWLLGLTASVHRSIDSTSLVTVDARGRGFIDGGLWTSDLGQRYLQAQSDAIRRGVYVRRVFILDRGELAPDADLRAVVEMQMSVGVDVRLLSPKDVALGRRTSLIDFVIFDQALSYEATPATPASLATYRPVVVNTRLIMDAPRVRDRIQRFEDLWESATSLPSSEV